MIYNFKLIFIFHINNENIILKKSNYMKLFQALKEKQKLSGEISKLKQRVLNNNSILKGNERDYSVKETMIELLAKENMLIQMKFDIQNANKPIYKDIFRLSELKGRLQFLKSINTTNGIKTNYSDESIEYEAELSRTEVDTLIDEIVAQIYKIQDELDMFNHTTNI